MEFYRSASGHLSTLKTLVVVRVAKSETHSKLNQIEDSSDTSQRKFPVWMRGLIFVALGGLLTFTLARWTTLAGILVSVGLISLALRRFIQKGARPSFSLISILLVTGLIACSIVLWMTGDPWLEAQRFPGYEANIAMSSDGKMVAVSQGVSILIRETKTGKTIQTIAMNATEAALKANQKWTFKMEFSLDGKSLMTVDWKTYPCLIDIASGEEIRRWPTNSGICPLATAGTRFVANSVINSSAGMTLQTCDVYDVERDEPIFTIRSNDPYRRALSPCGTFLLVGIDDANAELWNVNEQRLVGTIPTTIHSPLSPFFAKFSSDEKSIAVPTLMGIAVWDVTQCRKVSEWKPRKYNYVSSLEWSPDGSRLVASYIELIGSTNPAAVAIGIGTKNAIDHSYLIDRNCREIAPIYGTNAKFSPSGERVATIFGGVVIVDGLTGEPLTHVRGRPMAHALSSPAIQFSPGDDWMFVNGDPIVYRRARTEFWYGHYRIPAFWGMVLFLTITIMRLVAAPKRLRTIVLHSSTSQSKRSTIAPEFSIGGVSFWK